jgi:hypothetical protein
MTINTSAKWYIWLAVILLPCLCKAQDSKNVVYVEVLGPGILYSVNYERVITDNVTARIGASIFSYSYYSGESSVVVLPMMANYLWGSGSSKLELGAGADVMVSREKHYGDMEPIVSPRITSDSNILLVGALGYRYQPSDGGFHFRIVASPIVSPYTGYFFPSLGCSAGIGF